MQAETLRAKEDETMAVVLRGHLAPTLDQRRALALSLRPQWQVRLAAEWRVHMASLFQPCDRCGYRGNKHAMWCPYTDY